MTNAALVVDDVVHQLAGSQVTVRHGDTTVTVALHALGELAVESALAVIAERLAAGDSLEQAAREAQQTSGDAMGRTQRRERSDGGVVLDDTAAATPQEVRGSLRVLADVARDRGRSIAVLGELDCPPDAWFDEHDSLGRVIVRLDISQLVVVGSGARHIHNAAGLEGSWDGESVLVDSVDQAYDVVRAQAKRDDVVLVSGGARTPLGAVVARLLGAAG